MTILLPFVLWWASLSQCDQLFVKIAATNPHSKMRLCRSDKVECDEAMISYYRCLALQNGFGLEINGGQSTKSNNNPDNRSNEIGAIERVVSGVVGFCILLVGTWCLFAYAGELWSLILFACCFLSSIPFLDTGICGWSGWINMLK